jgi:hypothetical protein
MILRRIFLNLTIPAARFKSADDLAFAAPARKTVQSLAQSGGEPGRACDQI